MSSDESENDENAPPLKRARSHRPFVNFPFDDLNVRRRFRLRNDLLEWLLLRVGNDLEPSDAKVTSFSTKEKLLMCLRFLATSGFYRLVGDAHGPSETSIWHHLHNTVEVIKIEGYLRRRFLAQMMGSKYRRNSALGVLSYINECTAIQNCV